MSKQPKSATNQVHGARRRFEVSVIMERSEVRRGQWSYPQWTVSGVVAMDSVPTGGLQKTQIHSDGEVDRYLWTGLSLVLYQDAAESYWYNLQGQQPSLFVVCRAADDDDPNSELVPVLVTADHDEGGAYLEGDDSVFVVPIPQEVYVALERFVVNHYMPQEKRKRKRNQLSDTRGQTPKRRH